MSDEELFERRFTHLGLARTLAADATIRDVQDAPAHDTVAADAHREELPQISFDLRNDGPLGAERTPDLSSRVAAARGRRSRSASLPCRNRGDLRGATMLSFVVLGLALWPKATKA
jgi:hypothetical protein